MIGAAFLDYLVNALWQAPLLGLGAAALVRLGSLGPLGRHRVWLTCLALVVVLPTLSLVPLIPNSTPAPSAPVDATPVVVTPEMAAALNAMPAPTPAALPSVFQVDERVAWALAIAFAAAVGFGLVRLVAGWLAVRNLVKGAAPVVLPADLAAELRQFAKSHGAAMPRIRQSDRVAGPAVAGALRATILVPVDFASRPQAEVRAALLHEIARVVRRDYAVNLAGEALALPLWWHPALHLIAAEVRRSRELVCDAMASTAMRSQTAYARSLVSLAGAIDPAQAQGASVAVGLFGKSLLEERLMHLIGPKRPTGPALKALGLIGGGAVAAGVLGAASLLHVSTALAQPAPAPQAPPAVQAPLATPAAMPAPAAMATPAAAPTPPAMPAMAAQAAEAPVAAQAVVTSDDADADAADSSDGTQVVIDQDRHGHKHKWVSRSGKTYTVINDQDGDLTPEQQARLEESVSKATAEAVKAAAMVNSPEFKAQMAAIKSNQVALKAKLAALKALDGPKLRAQIKEAQLAAMKDVDVVAIQDKAMKAKLKALKVLDDPEIKAKIERAQRLEQSPEWRKAEADLQAAAARLRDLAKQEEQ
ncbi:MAG TPA: M56 family metallopeptidase [Caulobacteraceae bacterium]|jgi:beta-lactamase regulating signal transducer with metallopeptidase domain